ncbi:MAG: radical SAM protein [Brevinematales bacterium]|jgi:organic radical activating enzyme
MGKLGYDIQFLWLYLNQCNLNCSYCSNYFLSKEFNKIPPIDIERLIKSFDSSGKRVQVIFTGGEPLFIPNFIEACKEITKNHRVMVISNFTSDKLKEFAEKIDPSRACFLSSLHIKELETKNLVGRYIENYYFCREKGFNISIEEVAYPGLSGKAREYKKFFNSKGINFKYVPYYGFYNEGKYPDDYSGEEIDEFGLLKADLDRYNRKPGYCNAGFNNFVAMPGGDIFSCFRLMRPCGNIYNGIPDPKKMLKCNHSFCECCLSKTDEPLFHEALLKNKIKKHLGVRLLDPV